MAREKAERKMIAVYEEETRVQETCRVQVRKGGNYRMGQVRSIG